MSIYSNLFRYQPRLGRRPLEDFLSEALVDLLNRLPTEAQSDFVTRLLLHTSDATEQWSSFIASNAAVKLKWQTQRRIPNGIIDILLTADDEPVIIIENKIGAGFRTRQTRDREDGEGPDGLEEASTNQLHTYGRWLVERRRGAEWRGGLVVLTHFSKPPDDFGTADYGPPYTGVCRWHSIWRWARRNAFVSSGDDEPKFSAGLSDELADFLEKENMMSDFATMQDLVKAQIYAESASRIERSFALVSKRLDSFRKTLGAPTPRIHSMEFNSGGPLLWSWIYFKNPARIRDNWHIAWGIMFPTDETDWWSGCMPKLPQVPYVFVTALKNEGKEPKLPIHKLLTADIPVGWSIDAEEGELIVAKPCHVLRQDPEGWAEDFAEFVLNESEKARLVMLMLEERL